jgi:small subunit ribosomal protein S21
MKREPAFPHDSHKCTSFRARRRFLTLPPVNPARYYGKLVSISCNLVAAQRGSSGGVLSLAEVRIQEGEPLENALRRFKRKVQQEDIIKEVKRHSFYLKPGEKRRVKEALARKRNRKKARKEQD